MPFKSQAQRSLFYSALTNPALRRKLKMSLAAIRKMLEHDEGGKLPKKAKGG